MKDPLAIVRDAGGVELAERLAHLDAVRAGATRPRDEAIAPPDARAAVDADVVVLGGGLSILVAAAIAAHGARVIVVERARAGVAHREWNASGAELAALVRGGLLTEAELDALVVARYARGGVCRFHGGAPHAVEEVLDHAIDAGALLARVRGLAERRGVRFLDGHEVTGLAAGGASVRIAARARDGGDAIDLVARLVVDARGAASPYACADLVCPTVGGVMRGLARGDAPDAIDPRVGEILITTEGVEDGRQHLWEAFPGRDGDVTVYLFYYAPAAAAGSLAALYARCFQTLGRYKRGDATLVRPTFGFIPGWSRLGAGPRSPSPRVLLVGDAAARHSPLTFCGFGSMLRSFDPAARAIAGALATGRPPRARHGVLADDGPIHALTGALARMLTRPPRDPDALNALLDAAFGTLAEMGDAYGALLRDEMHARDFTAFLRRTAARRPAVYREVLGALGAPAVARWGVRLATELARGA